MKFSKTYALLLLILICISSCVHKNSSRYAIKCNENSVRKEDGRMTKQVLIYVVDKISGDLWLLNEQNEKDIENNSQPLAQSLGIADLSYNGFKYESSKHLGLGIVLTRNIYYDSSKNKIINNHSVDSIIAGTKSGSASGQCKSIKVPDAVYTPFNQSNQNN